MAAVGCKSNNGGAVVSAEIGPDGGTVSSADSILTIAILPGALDETITLTIERSNEPPSVYGPAFVVHPNVQLDIPATVSYRFELPADTSETAIGWVDPDEYDAGQARWRALETIQLDESRDLVTGVDPQVSRFYALLDERVSTPPVTTGSSATDTGEPSTTGPSSATDTGDPDTGTTNGTDPTDPGTTTTTDPTDPGTTETTDPTDPGSTTDDGGESSGTDTGGDPCDALPGGPLAPVEFNFDGSPLDGNAEDMTFSAVGTIIARNGDDLVQIDPAGTVTNIPVMTPLPATLGLRWTTAGNIVTADRDTGALLQITPAGVVTELWGGLTIPNGVYPAIDGNIFFTDFVQARAAYIDAAGTAEVVLGEGGAEAPQTNGIIYDPDRDFVYYVSYGPGIVWRVDVSDLANPGNPENILTIAAQGPGDTVGLDGLAMDVCGNLYVVDQNGDEAVPGSLFRVNLDAAGDPIGDAELLVEAFDANVANAVFAQGAGWEAYPTTLFLVGLPGRIFTVDVGIEGAPTAVTG